MRLFVFYLLAIVCLMHHPNLIEITEAAHLRLRHHGAHSHARKAVR